MPSSRPPISTLFPYTTLFRSQAEFFAAGVSPRLSCLVSPVPPGCSFVKTPVMWAVAPGSRFCFCRRSVCEKHHNSPRRVATNRPRSEEHTSELQSLTNLVCRLLDHRYLHSFPTRRSSDLRRNFSRLAYRRDYRAWYHRCRLAVLS